MGQLINYYHLMDDINKRCNCMSSAYDVVKIITEQKIVFNEEKVIQELEDYLFENECVEDFDEIENIIKRGGVK